MATTTAPSRSTAVAAAPQKAGSKKINPGRVAAWTAMIILILITLFPFYWMIRTAFSTSRSLFSDPNSLLPVDFTLGAFKRVFGLATPAEAQAEGGSGAAVNFWLFLRNSIVYATLSRLVRCSSAHWRPTHSRGSAGPGGTRSSSCS